MPILSVKVVEVHGVIDRSAVELDGKRFANALSMGRGVIHNAPYIEFNLGRKFARFKAMVGVSDEANNDVSALYVVTADGRDLFRSRRMGVGSRPELIDVDVRDVLRLRLALEDPDFRLGAAPDCGYWINPRLVTGKIEAKPTLATIMVDGNPLATKAHIIDGMPCVPLDVLQSLGRVISYDWNADAVELRIRTRR